MEVTHRRHVEALLAGAAADHASLMCHLSPELRASVPVDAQGVTQATVLHARVFGRAPLARETVIASFVDGARVRADALAALADVIGGEPLGQEVRRLLVAHPPPVDSEGDDVVPALRATYAAQERAAVMIAASLDGA